MKCSYCKVSRVCLPISHQTQCMQKAALVCTNTAECWTPVWSDYPWPVFYSTGSITWVLPLIVMVPRGHVLPPLLVVKENNCSSPVNEVMLPLGQIFFCCCFDFSVKSSRALNWSQSICHCHNLSHVLAAHSNYHEL